MHEQRASAVSGFSGESEGEFTKAVSDERSFNLSQMSTGFAGRELPGRPIWGHALLMRPARAASGEPFVTVPLRSAPNELRDDQRGSLTRWKHRDLRPRKVQEDSERALHNVKLPQIQICRMEPHAHRPDSSCTDHGPVTTMCDR